MPASQQRPNFSDANLKGAFFRAFEETMAPSYLNEIATPVPSDRAAELYGWLGSAPVMREWKGGRHPQTPNEFQWTIYNKKYESSITIPVDDVRRDKTGQHDIYAAQLGERAAENPILILSDLLQNGETSLCFDGQYFFDTDHSEGNSGQQANKIDVDISELQTVLHGSGPTNPSDEEIEKTILKMIKQFYKMKDDQGQPVNQTAKNFALVSPIDLMDQVMGALTNKIMVSGRENTLIGKGFSITPYFDARLNWTTKLAMFRTDHTVKAFVHQLEVDNELSSITDGNSEYVTLNDQYFFGVKRIEAVGYGDYKKAVLANLV